MAENIFDFVSLFHPPLPHPTVSAPAELNFHVKSVLAGYNLTSSSTVSLIHCKHVPQTLGAAYY